jgi:hypothetical protein
MTKLLVLLNTIILKLSITKVLNKSKIEFIHEPFRE